jgi:hypothetical protein
MYNIVEYSEVFRNFIKRLQNIHAISNYTIKNMTSATPLENQRSKYSVHKRAI